MEEALTSTQARAVRLISTNRVVADVGADELKLQNQLRAKFLSLTVLQRNNSKPALILNTSKHHQRREQARKVDDRIEGLQKGATALQTRATKPANPKMTTTLPREQSGLAQRAENNGPPWDQTKPI